MADAMDGKEDGDRGAKEGNEVGGRDGKEEDARGASEGNEVGEADMAAEID